MTYFETADRFVFAGETEINERGTCEALTEGK